jgi:hypothetical protein
MTRWKASLIHLALSAIVATSLVGVMLFLWYPPPYFGLMGGMLLIVLIAGCDVVLGPLLTLIVFKSGKKGLVLDLSLIAFMQAAALTYGLHTMFEARPVFVVFAVDRFEVSAANEIREDDLAKARPEFASLPLTGPRVVGAVLPKDANKRFELAIGAIGDSHDIRTMPQQFVPYTDVKGVIAYKARPLADLLRKHPAAREAIANQLDVVGDGSNGLAYVPIVGRFHSMSAIVDRRSGEVKTVVNVDPW